MTIRIKILKLLQPGVVTLLLMIFLQASFLKSQEVFEKNTIYLIGQVTNQYNGGPIKEQEVLIASDTNYYAGFNYQTVVYTDFEGYFYDTIITGCNKGALKIYTIDYLSNSHDTTVYFRFNWSEINILFVNIVLPCEPPQIIYQANFYYAKNPFGQNPSEYQFFDLTNSCNILSHQWDFGDGSFSNETNPVHEYLQNGIYRVNLTVTIQPELSVEPVVTSIVKVINVTLKDYFYIGGHVMAGYFPIDHGEAYLFKIENNIVVPIDTAVFNDTLGFYLFFQVIEGQYLVKADLSPNSVHFNHFLTTYYSNKPLWTEADTIFHEGNNCEYDIELIPVTQSYSGHGSISGSISHGFDSKDGKNFPASNVEIMLLNENFEPSVCTHSNEDGEFEFQDLDLGNYYIHAEVTGKFTYPLSVCLSETACELNGISLTIGTFSVFGSVNSNGVDENDWENTIGEPYPNPVSSSVMLDIQSNQCPINSISLLNSTGQIVKEFNLSLFRGYEHCVFETESLTPGIYFIRIDIQNQVLFRKLIKK